MACTIGLGIELADRRAPGLSPLVACPCHRVALCGCHRLWLSGRDGDGCACHRIFFSFFRLGRGKDEAAEPPVAPATVVTEEKATPLLLLDTSVIIDGRVADVAEAGFLAIRN